MPVVSVFNCLKNKELLVYPGQEFVILAEDLLTLGHKLVRGENYSELACLSCARQVVRLRQSFSKIVTRCNEPLDRGQELLTCDHFENESLGSQAKRSTALRSPTGMTPSAKRNKDGSQEDAPNANVDLQSRQSSRRSLNFAGQQIEQHKEENSLTLEETMQEAMNLPQQEKPVVKVSIFSIYLCSRREPF